MPSRYVLILRAKWTELPGEIIAVYDPTAVVQAFERRDELASEDAGEYQGASIELDMFEVIGQEGDGDG